MKILEYLFGCSHRHTTLPLKLKLESQAHVTCLNCGREFLYDWKEMRRGAAIKPRAFGFHSAAVGFTKSESAEVAHAR